MITQRKAFRLYIGFVLTMLLPFTIVQAQTNEKSEPRGQSTSEIEQLKSKLDALVSLLEQQQRQMTEMQKRIDAIDSKTKAASLETDLKSAALEVAQTQKQEPGSSPVEKEARGADKPALLAGWDKNHAFFKSSDGRFVTEVTGYGQLDWRGYESGNTPPNTFLVRRARLALEGKIERYYDFKIEGDFADTASTPLRDLFVRVHRIDELMVSFGQFRVPISQEEIRSDAFQDFVERSMVNNLVPSRSPGVMVSGIINKGVFEYQVGTFNGKGLLAANNNDTPESAIRLRFAPWKNGNGFWTKGLAFGGAYTQGNSLGGVSVRGRTESQSFTFFSPDAVNGQLNRANGEITWLLGPAAIRAEYDQTNQERENLGPNGTTLPGVVGKGYVAQFTYLLTGEAKPDAGAVSPKRNLFGDDTNGHGLGAWELKVRYANLQIANGTSKSNRAESIYFGPNWYLNRFVRYMLDFGVERFKDPLRTPKPGDNNFFVVLTRIQVAF